jgi:hypothetical protein
MNNNRIINPNNNIVRDYKSRRTDITYKKAIMKRFIVILIMLIILQSCKNQEKINNNVIERIDKTDLSILRGISIYFRSKGDNYNTNIYFVSTFQINCSPYIIECDPLAPQKSIINKDLVLESCGQDYLDDQTIIKALAKYIELNVVLIYIDEDGNVYINPSEQERPTLLKKVKNSTPRDFNQFKH